MKEVISDQTSNEPNQSSNFIHEKLIQFLKFYTFTPLDKYTSSQFKLLDTENKISNEKMIKVNNVFNQLRNVYINEITTEISKFEDKFALKEKLKYKSDIMLIDILLKELDIPLESIIKYESFCQMEKQEESLMQFYLTKYLSEKNKELVERNEAKKKELAELKEKNKLKINL